MADYTYTLYDTAIFGNVANFENILFQVAAGGDATHTESFTNSRGAGSLPTTEKFTVDRISVFPDFNTLLTNDIKDVWRGSFLEMRVADFIVLKAPLSLFADNASYGGTLQLAAAANITAIGLAGEGYALSIPVLIPGGTAWRVRVVQAIALSAASLNVKVCLNGTLSISG